MYHINALPLLEFCSSDATMVRITHIWWRFWGAYCCFSLSFTA
jgi:hypothetical protein